MKLLAKPDQPLMFDNKKLAKLHQNIREITTGAARGGDHNEI